MKKTALCSFLIVCLLAVGLGSVQAADPVMGVVLNDTYLFSVPDNNDQNNILAPLVAGSAVVVVSGPNNGWLQVSLFAADGTQFHGYVGAHYISYVPPTDPTPTPSPTPTPTPSPTPVPGGLSGWAYVRTYNSGDRVPLYAIQTTEAIVLDTYPNGTSLYIVNGDGTWCLVEIAGRRGYMQTQYISYQNPNTPTVPPSAGTAVVNNPDPTDKLNLRAQPDIYSTSLGKYGNGTAVRVLEYGATWCRVEVSGVYGYMMTRYLYFGSAKPTQPPPTGGTATYAYVNNPVPTDRLKLRQYASQSSAVLGWYYNGTVVTVLEYGATWCNVQVDGLYGYMMTRFLSFSGSYVPAPTPPPVVPGNPTYATVTGQRAGEWLNLRALPSTGSAVLGKYYNGQSVLVLSHAAEWCRVQVNEKLGYMMTRYLSFGGSSGGGGGASQSGLAVVNNPIATQRLNLRAEANTSSRSLAQFYNGVMVTILSYGSEWCRVEVNGLRGYMMTRYLRML